jgi:cytochrome c biogenesis protein CcmG/thiol:disulfide interchange protein DsbE
MIKNAFRTAALAAGLMCSAGTWALEPGQAAPALELAGVGSPVSLAKLQGKVVFVDFWASWCGPCKQSFPWLNEMQAKYGAKGLQIVGVNVDTKRADADKFLSEIPANFRVAFDAQGDSPKRYQIKGMPSSVLVGPDGKVIKVHSGFRPEERQELEAAIVAALAAAK